MDTAISYLMAIECLEAKDMLVKMQIADYPNMKKEDRKKLHRKVHKLAFPKEDNFANKDQIKDFLKRVNNGR